MKKIGDLGGGGGGGGLYLAAWLDSFLACISIAPCSLCFTSFFAFSTESGLIDTIYAFLQK